MLERSLTISSREMQDLYANLQASTASLIAAERDKLQAIISSLGAGLAVLDANWQLISLNPEGERLVGWQASELAEQPLIEHVVGSTLDLAALQAALVAGETYQTNDAVLLTKAGAPLPISLLLSPVRGAAGLAGIVVVFFDVTQRKRDEQALRDSEQRYRALLAAAERQAHELALLERVRTALARELDLPVVFRTVVEAIATTLGYRQVSLYLIEGPLLVMQHQVGYEQFITHLPISRGVMGRVARTGVPVLLEDVASDPGFVGAFAGLTSEICVPLVVDGAVVGVVNVETTGDLRLGAADLRLILALSEHLNLAMSRARLYAAAHDSEQKLRAIIEHSTDAIFIKDRAGRYLLMSPAGARQRGLTVSAMLGHTDAELSTTLPALDAADRLVLTARQPHSYETILGTDAQPLVLSTTKFPYLAQDGAVLGVIGISRDITERARVAQSLQAAKEAAEAANRAKSTFLANMSHELRTPLNSVLGFTQLLQLELDARGAQDLLPDLAEIQRAGQHLLRLLSDILDLSKIESERVELLREVVVIDELLATVTSLARPLVEQNRNRLRIATDPAVRSLVSDGGRLRQVLLNLVSNAAKFTDQGDITLEVAADTPGWLRFVVRDTGIGITPEQQERLFRPFMQADASTTRKYGGTGLGLVISQRLCQLLGGTITLRSQPGVGTTFIVRLPLAVMPGLPAA